MRKETLVYIAIAITGVVWLAFGLSGKLEGGVGPMFAAEYGNIASVFSLVVTLLAASKAYFFVSGVLRKATAPSHLSALEDQNSRLTASIIDFKENDADVLALLPEIRSTLVSVKRIAENSVGNECGKALTMIERLDAAKIGKDELTSLRSHIIYVSKQLETALKEEPWKNL